MREERRRGREQERDGGERGSLLVLLCDEICFRREREREREIEIEKGRGETKIVREREAFLPVSPLDGISFARERARGRERRLEKEER